MRLSGDIRAIIVAQLRLAAAQVGAIIAGDSAGAWKNFGPSALSGRIRQMC